MVVDFRASWCSPCLQELPSLKELYAKYRELGVEFIGVSLDYPADQGGLEALKKRNQNKDLRTKNGGGGNCTRVLDSGSEPGANASPPFKDAAARMAQHDG